MEHLLALKDLSKEEMLRLINKGIDVKQHPEKYRKAAEDKTLLMIFQAPSLRTMLSFNVAMFQMRGNAIYYGTEHSPWGAGKESIEDVGKVISRYCDIVEARIYSQEDLVQLAKNSTIPVINGMTNAEHPCQILGDLMTVLEKKKKLEGLKLAYLGDSNNNVTYSLMYAAATMGMDISVGCPKAKDFFPAAEVISACEQKAKKSKSRLEITDDAGQAIKDADIVYTDSWMSYRVDPALKEMRTKALKPYQVNAALFSKAKKDAMFLHCLPAMRNQEVTADVIDGKNSFVFDEAENRLHIQKAIIAELLGK